MRQLANQALRWRGPLIAGLALVLGAACAAQYRSADQSRASNVAVITRLSPASGRVGVAYPVQVTVEGRGFAVEGNVITFGGVALRPLPSTDEGTRITFWVPKEAPSTGEVPPMELPPGDYEVTVTTANGTSEPMTFVLVEVR